MAIVSFTNYKRKQTRGMMSAVMRYTMQEKKTLWADRRLVTGVNCSLDTACGDFMTTKRLHHKEGGTLFYHMVQSFPVGESVDPVTAHAAALELANYFSDCEVLVCTHIDRDHIHSHFIINSVQLEHGKKLHISSDELNELRQRNDEVCMKFALPVFQKQRKKQVKSVSNAEYHTALKGESWKFRLINTIDECMRYAESREEFISLMESEGYGVRWEQNRKSITYTTPNGMKCRDDRLHDERYLKEGMEHEFRIRSEIISGGTQTAQRTATTDSEASRGNTSHESGVGGDDGLHLHADLSHGKAEWLSEEGQRRIGAMPDTDADRGTDKRGEASGVGDRTGWETEREIFLSAKVQTAQTASAAPGWSDSGSPADDRGSVASALVGLGRRLEQSQSAGPVIDSTTTRHHADSKTLRREKQKKIAQGHAKDDHEDEQNWQQTM